MPLTTKAASELAKFVFGGEDISFWAAAENCAL